MGFAGGAEGLSNVEEQGRAQQHEWFSVQAARGRSRKAGSGVLVMARRRDLCVAKRRYGGTPFPGKQGCVVL